MKKAKMHSMDWDHVRHFLEVVRTGSVSQAALRLGVNQTTVSRRISSLETHLKRTMKTFPVS
ncbi:MAG: LysR family transcriptional regulator, partial [Chromatiales bacterium]